MKKRLLTGLIFMLTLALGFVLKFYVSNYFFDVIILGVSCIAGYEASKLFIKMGHYNDKIMATAFPCVAMAVLLLCISTDDKIGVIYSIIMLFAVMALFLLVTFLITVINKKVTTMEMKIYKIAEKRVKYSFKKALNTVITFIYPSFLLLFLTFINHFEDMTTSFSSVTGMGGRLSLFVLLLALLIPIFTDTFAFLTGGIFGGKKLAPKISPNKTISGAVGGLVWSVILSITVFFIFNAIPSFEAVFETAKITFWNIGIVVLLGSAISQCGDLLESFFKRSAGVKDSGKILPGHGGMLDRFDSHIAVAPFIFIAFAIIFALI